MVIPRVLVTLLTIIMVNSFSMVAEKRIVVTSDNIPIDGATVSIMELPDSIIRFVGISDVKGCCYVPDSIYDNKKQMTVSVTYFGFLPEINIPKENVKDTVRLTPVDVSLDEVIVRGYRPSLKREAGKFIFDPEQLKKESLNCLEVLKFTPLITVSDDGAGILGKGTSAIFINGRNPMMSQSAVIDMLKSTPPSQIKRIEIVTEPGSSYKASFSGGIINVVLSQPNQGYVGSATVDIKYAASRFSPAIYHWGGYSNKKFNASMNIAYKGINKNRTEEASYEYKAIQKTVVNNTHTKGWMNYLYGNINATYDLSSKSIIGISASLSGSKGNEKSTIRSNTADLNGESRMLANINSTVPLKPSYGFQGFYELSFGTNNNKLEVSADYYSDISKTDIDYLFPGDENTQNTDITSRGWHGKIQTNLNPTPKQTVQIGYDFFRSNIDYRSIARFMPNHFRYIEMINSGFLQYRAMWSNQFSTSVGLRMEAAHRDGTQYDQGNKFKDDKVDFFPTLSMSWNIPSWNQGISIDFSRRITRPFYDFMNPYKIYNSETTYSMGNPELKPYYTWNASLYYLFHRDFMAGGSFFFTTDCINEYTYMDGDKTVSSYINGGNQRQYFIFLSYNKLIGDILRIKADTDVDIYNRKFKMNNTDLGFKSVVWSLFINNSLMLSSAHNLKMTLSYRLSSPIKMVTKNGKWKNLLSLGLSKSFNSGISVSFDAWNLLCFKNDYHYMDAQYGYDVETLNHVSDFTLRLSYVFGKKKVSGARNSSASALEKRLKRD